jgi:hypothetical protein
MKNLRLLTLVTLGGIVLIISFQTLRPIVIRSYTPNLQILDPQMALESGSLILGSIIIQLGLLALVLLKGYTNVKATLLGVGAGILLILPLTLKELDKVIGKAIETRDYSILEVDQSESPEGDIKTLIVEGQRMPVPTEMANKLQKLYPALTAKKPTTNKE